MRTIIHVDMDAFFAAVEQRDNPELVGKPVIVGGLSVRGVVSTASYEARKYGVFSAMPMTEARRRCPQGIYLPGNHKKYRQVSLQIREILSRFSPLIEPLSIDEAFLDVTGMEWLYKNPVEIARQIKAAIRQELHLTASAGVASNKFLAKLASDLQKPDGLVVVPPGEERQFLQELPVRRLWGVGPTAAETLKKLGFFTIGQIAVADPIVLEKHLGKQAYELIQLAQGMDDRLVTPEYAPKSIGNEETFALDIYGREAVETMLWALAEKVGRRLRQDGYCGRTVTVKLRYPSFRTVTRSQTLPEAISQADVIYQYARELLGGVELQEGVRLLGITVSHLEMGKSQASLFSLEDERKIALSAVTDRLKDKFGEKILVRGRLLQAAMNDENRSADKE